jgi:hypothetical protein
MAVVGISPGGAEMAWRGVKFSSHQRLAQDEGQAQVGRRNCESVGWEVEFDDPYKKNCKSGTDARSGRHFFRAKPHTDSLFAVWG